MLSSSNLTSKGEKLLEIEKFLNAVSENGTSDSAHSLAFDQLHGESMSNHHAHHGSHVDHHRQDHGDHSMKMWFHSGYDEVILFDFWRINSFNGLIISCFIIFVAACLYEGIKWFRVYLQLYSSRGSRHQSHYEEGADKNLINGDGNQNNCSKSITQPISSSRQDSGPFSLDRLIQALLYMMQLTLAYWLMLVAMTYNVWLTAAVVTGAAFGHWLFAVLKCLNPQVDQLDTFTSDACH